MGNPPGMVPDSLEIGGDAVAAQQDAEVVRQRLAQGGHALHLVLHHCLERVDLRVLIGDGLLVAVMGVARPDQLQLDAAEIQRSAVRLDRLWRRDRLGPCHQILADHRPQTGQVRRRVGLLGGDRARQGNELGVAAPEAESADACCYPDVVVLCAKPQFHDQRKDVLTDAILVGEVLAPSTEGYDRGGKFARYRALPGLRHYLLIAQDRIAVDLFTRQPDGRWLLDG